VGLSEKILEAGLGIAGLNAATLSSDDPTPNFAASPDRACRDYGLIGRNPSTSAQDPMKLVFIKHGGDLLTRSQYTPGLLDPCKVSFLKATEAMLDACRWSPTLGFDRRVKKLAGKLMPLSESGCCPADCDPPPPPPHPILPPEHSS